MGAVCSAWKAYLSTEVVQNRECLVRVKAGLLVGFIIVLKYPDGQCILLLSAGGRERTRE